MKSIRSIAMSGSSQPCGNSYSLVPEIAGSQSNPGPKAPITKQGPEPKVTMSTQNRNSWKRDLSGTGLS